MSAVVDMGQEVRGDTAVLNRQRVSLMVGDQVIAVRLFEGCSRSEVDQFMQGAEVAARALGIWVGRDYAGSFSVRWEER